MALKLDIELTDEQIKRMKEIPETSWFTSVSYLNADSPVHPNREFILNNEYKQQMVTDWISHAVKGKSVLDLFSANGIFTFLAALAGAREIVGVEYSKERVECAEFLASTLKTDCKISFVEMDVYKINEYFDRKFDVGLCLGGLYHVADPALLLRLLGDVITEHLIMQTSQVLSFPGNWAKFIVRGKDLTLKGMTSIRGGYGTWRYTPGCLRELLLHGGFRILEETRPPFWKRRRFPWYLAYCERINKIGYL